MIDRGELVQGPGGIYVPLSFAEAAGVKRSDAPDMHAVATTLDGRDITRGYVLPQLRMLPQDTILRKRGFADLRVYEDLLRDDQVATSFRKLRLAVTSKEWVVEAGGKRAIDKKAADSLKAQLQALAWDGTTDKMLYGDFYGYSVAEMLWARDGREVVIDDIKVRKARRFFFDGAMRLRLQTTDNPMGEILGPRKFWLHIRGADNDDEPYGLGLGHYLYWPVLFKRNGLRFWLIFLEKFGMPTAKGTYRAGATPEEKSNLLQALASVTADSGIILPEGMAVELIEAARQGTADYKDLHDAMDQAIARVITGHSATSEATPGRLGGESMAESSFDDIVKAVADSVCESFNRGPAQWLTAWNYPGAKPPRVWRNTQDPVDWVNMSTAIANLAKAGKVPTDEKLEELFDCEFVDVAAKGGDDNPAATGGGAGGSQFSESGADAVPTTDDLDDLADAGAAEWEEVLGPLVEPIQRLAEEVTAAGGGKEEFLARLPELFDQMDETELAQRLGVAMIKARGLGDATDNPAA